MLKFTRPQMSDDLIYSPYRNMWFAPVEIFTLIASTRQSDSDTVWLTVHVVSGKVACDGNFPFVTIG